ncbi:MAG: M50 family metallopeptidase [Alphaproteobacteria bacterium]|nr:M50 family metallopeptidase [Alphaproteobacteria bacterium]MBQ8630469.1 M50 family metallopeptidase [Alphaproteobacteria bacterium]
MRILVDRLIDLFKWPVGVFMFLSLPAFIQSFGYFRFFELHYVWLIAGFIFFFICRSMMDKEINQTFEVATHELTHGFFALLTLHKVKSIRVNPDDTGGEMAFAGRGNWLIIIAPYFFPLVALFVMFGISIYTHFAPSNFILNGVLGFFIAQHLDAVGSQIHEKQTDLIKVSYKFCFLFLPSANLWAIGSMLAFNSRSWGGIYDYMRLINYLNNQNWIWAKRFFSELF